MVVGRRWGGGGRWGGGEVVCMRGGGEKRGSRRRGKRICEDVKSVCGRRETSETAFHFYNDLQRNARLVPRLCLVFCRLQYKARGKQ